MESKILKPKFGELLSKRMDVERGEKWDEWRLRIPALKFPSSWKIQVIPPFAGAMVRFRVVKPNGVDKSVYLDVFSRLGAWDTPYWEVYPYKDDVGRCEIDDVDKLMKMLKSK